jgi:hypothetical protein
MEFHLRTSRSDTEKLEITEDIAEKRISTENEQFFNRYG